MPSSIDTRLPGYPPVPHHRPARRSRLEAPVCTSLIEPRSFVHLAGAGLAHAAAVHRRRQPAAPGAADWFPRQDPAVAKEMVGVSHRNLVRVRELVERQPALARAAVDWGFGDWETALGAASHTGRREIAELLLANGAQPSLFSAAMMGQLDVVRAFVESRPGIQGILGPHSITLLAHARAGGPDAVPVLKYLEGVGGADQRPSTQPLAPADRDAVVGRYNFGAGASDRFDVDVDRDQLGITRPAQTADSCCTPATSCSSPRGRRR